MVFIVVLSVLILDQASKFLAAEKLILDHSIPVIDNFFYLTLVHNRGAAFGILKGYTFLFVLTSLVTIVFIVFHFKKQELRKPSLYVLSLALILSGGIGNLIDRLSVGYVIDFLDFRPANIRWTVFNIADSAISIGAVLLIWSILAKKTDRGEDKKA